MTSLAQTRKKPGGSNAGKYKGITKFAGPSGGAPAGTFPINTKAHGESALKLAHNAPKPAGIRKAVFKEFPSLFDASKYNRDGTTKK